MTDVRWKRIPARVLGRGHAAARRVGDRDTRRSVNRLGRDRRTPLDVWHRQSSERHEHYRSEVEPAASTACVICVSQRPHRLADVIAGVSAQRHVDVEFVLVPTSHDWDRSSVDDALVGLSGASVVWDAQDKSLGEALNAGLAVATERFVAKMDDDDHYGPSYLVDALRAHRVSRAAIVGKHSYYVDHVDHPTQLLRFPGNEFRYTSTIAGGTMLIDREQVPDLRFDDRSLGEDRAFIEATLRRGRSVFAADRFNFVQHRGDSNTWRPPADVFLADCVVADSAAPEHRVDR